MKQWHNRLRKLEESFPATNPFGGLSTPELALRMLAIGERAGRREGREAAAIACAGAAAALRALPPSEAELRALDVITVFLVRVSPECVSPVQLDRLRRRLTTHVLPRLWGPGLVAGPEGKG